MSIVNEFGIASFKVFDQTFRVNFEFAKVVALDYHTLATTAELSSLIFERVVLAKALLFDTGDGGLRQGLALRTFDEKIDYDTFIKAIDGLTVEVRDLSKDRVECL